jgi:CheY-like chemotaxis protein
MKPLILLVEDDHDIREILVEVFSAFDYECSAFRTAQDALDDERALRSCDLLVVDFYLPGMNGIEFIQAARSRRPDLKAIVLTGSPEKSIQRSALELDHCYILYKPINMEDLKQVIESILF